MTGVQTCALPISKSVSSFEREIGKQILNNETDLEMLNEYALSIENVNNKSSHIEYVKSRLNDFIY